MRHRWLWWWLVALAAGCAAPGPAGDDWHARIVRAAPALVTLEAGTGALGSGFLVDAAGLVVTNAHLAAVPGLVVVDRSGVRHRPETVHQDDDLDLAVLRIAAPAVGVLTLREAPARIGEPVLALGNPLGLGLTASRGIISAEPAATGAVRRLQTDAAINAGNSGGPLLDARGRVIGVVNARTTVGQGIGFAVPADAVRRALATLKR